MSATTKFMALKHWWIPIVFLNILFVTVTAAYPHIPDFSQKWRLFGPFYLGNENNLAAWWSGITLLLAAILAFEKHDSKNKAWLIVAFVLAILSLDEIGSIHERVGIWKGWSGMLPAGCLLLGLFGYAILKIYKDKDSKINAIYLLIAFSIFCSVAFQEYLEHTLNWKPWMRGLRVGLEEGTELLGTFFLFLAVLSKDKISPILSNRLLPKAATLINLKSLFLIALVIHIVGCYVMTRFFDPFHRGNPMNWYPTAICFCVFLVCAWHSILSDQSKKFWWQTLTLACLLSSIGLMTNIFNILLPGIDNIISSELILERFFLFYLIQLFVMSTLFILTPKMKTPKAIAILIAIVALVALSIWGDSQWLRFSILGIYTFYLYMIITLNPPINEQASPTRTL